MKKHYLPFLIFILVHGITYSQEALSGSYGHNPEPVDCIPVSQRLLLQQEIQINRQILQQEGLLSEHLSEVNPLFIWPVIKWNGHDDSACYAVSNFVDHNPNFPNQITDYNCFSRSYDLSSGYNHAGIDIFTWPYSWNLMDDQKVAAIAAAPGVIIGKNDGAFDRNCGLNNSPANYFIIQHSDGSVAYYYHLKNGSLNPKNIGQSVTTGEYLGILGSSGSSTAPHLHFEVFDQNNQLIDPYAGNCNALNINSWWANQPDYFNGKIHRVSTHGIVPDFSFCPQPETPNEKDTFCTNEIIYLIGFTSELPIGDTIFLTVKNANNVITYQGNIVVNAFYSASYWYYFGNVTIYAPTPGQYTLTWSYKNTAASSVFYVVDTAPGQATINNLGNNLLSASVQGTSYSWYANGNLLPATTQTITGVPGTTYTVVVHNPCGASPISPPFLLPTSSIDDEELNGLQLVNPVIGGQLQLMGSALITNMEYIIMDMQGRLVQSGKMNSSFISVEHFSPGIYSLIVKGKALKFVVL